MNIPAQPRNRQWDDIFGTNIQLMPWIMPPVPLQLQALFHQHGTKRTLQAGESIFHRDGSIDALVLLNEGISGRAFGSLYNQSYAAMALSIPYRLAAGNHNFWGHRAGNGSYFVLTDAQVTYLDQDVMKSLIQSDEELSYLTNVFLELCFQSDRLGFATIALLPVVNRLQMFYLTWGFAYAKFVQINGEQWLEYSNMLPQEKIAQVVSASTTQLKRCVASLIEERSVMKDGNTWFVKAELLDPVWQWLRHSEEGNCRIKRLNDWRVCLTDTY